jgi:hypothetical protein
MLPPSISFAMSCSWFLWFLSSFLSLKKNQNHPYFLFPKAIYNKLKSAWSLSYEEVAQPPDLSS